LEQLTVQAKWGEITKKIKDAEDVMLTKNGETRIKSEILSGEDAQEREARLNAWWVEALDFIQTKMGEGEDFLSRVRDDLLAKEERERGAKKSRATNAKGHRLLSLAHQFRSMSMLKNVLFAELSELSKRREAVINTLHFLGAKAPTTAEVELSGNCKQCRHYLNKTGQVCDHCKAHVLLINYDGCLYRYRIQSTEQGEGKRASPKKSHPPGMNDDRSNEEDKNVVGFGSFRESSEAEQVLAHIVRHLRGASGPMAEEGRFLLEEGTEHLKRLQTMKQELKLSHEVHKRVRSASFYDSFL